jgi:hypothetical protein
VIERAEDDVLALITQDFNELFARSVPEVTASFKSFFNAQSNLLQTISIDLRPTYTTYQSRLSTFPFDRLNVATRNSFRNLTIDVDLWLDLSIRMAETYALNSIWQSNPNGQRTPPNPAVFRMETDLRVDFGMTTYVVERVNRSCAMHYRAPLNSFYQTYISLLNAASTNQLPNVSKERFPASIRSIETSLTTTRQLINILETCGALSQPNPETCIANFVSLTSCFHKMFFSVIFFQFTYLVGCY